MNNWFLSTSLMLFVSCSHPSTLDDPELITGLRFSPSAFDSFKSNTEIRYSLKSPVTVTIYLIAKGPNGMPYLVKTLVENVSETKGSHSHTWLGDTNQGSFAPSGDYVGIVQIEDKRFETSVLVFHF
ncbi:MAG: hypothetical protein WBD36_02410 [Bacteroidota bacterium]